MLADLPVLLQDLGTSKLLQKFKQQQAEREAATASGSNSDAPVAVGVVAGTSGIEAGKEVEAKKPSNFEESGIYDGEGNEKNLLNSSANKSPNKHLDTSMLANIQSLSSRKSSASRGSEKGIDR